MNQNTSHRTWTIPAHLIANARTCAGAKPHTMIDLLEQELNVGPEEFIIRLGNTLRYRVIDATHIARLSPAFDLLPLHEAAERNCLLGYDDGNLVCVLTDPFDMALQVWISQQGWLPQLCLTHRLTLKAFFAHADTGHGFKENI